MPPVDPQSTPTPAAPATPPRARPRRLSRGLRGGLINLALTALRPLLWLLPWRLVLAAGWTLGMLGFVAQPRRRRRAHENLRRAYGDALDERRIRAVTRRVFVHLGMNLAEICWVAARPSRAEWVAEIAGWEHAEAAIARGKGVVAMTGHVGSWELLAAASARRGAHISAVGRETQDDRVNDFLVGLREQLGIRTVLRGSTAAAREILRTLKAGNVLATLIDQDTKVEGIFVDFFGRPAYTPSGPATLALRSGAAILPCVIRRLPGGRHRIEFQPSFTLDRQGDAGEEVRRATERCTRWLEERIREDPAQWVWIHRRWRRPPRPPAGSAAAV